MYLYLKEISCSHDQQPILYELWSFTDFLANPNGFRRKHQYATGTNDKKKSCSKLLIGQNVRKNPNP